MKPFHLCTVPGLVVCVMISSGCIINHESSTSMDTSVTAAPLEAVLTTDVTMHNGWTTLPGKRNPGVALVSGFVHLKGAIANGTSSEAFTLPSGFRPPVNVFVPVALCGPEQGRLLIQPSGVVTISSGAAAFSKAQCMTSLEGVSFAVSASGFTTLTLENGWTHAPAATRNAAVTNDSGIIRFQGALANGASAPAFTLPSGFRPPTNVYVPVDLCNAQNGRLVIQPSGAVRIQAEGAFSDAQCRTSLEGVWFARDTSGFTTLTLQNGWIHAPLSTGTAGVKESGGIVHFKGAIANGTSSSVFTLPSAFRPPTSVFVPVDLCNVTKGRLLIQSSGDVVIQAVGDGTFSNAQCLTSLDGVSFILADYLPLALENGWTNAPSSTGDAAVGLRSGIVRFKGAIANGTSTDGFSSRAFTLPSELRPAVNVFVPVTLCNANKGSLIIQPSGLVTVLAEEAIADAQCMTSLEGASFALATSGFTPLTLENGWTHAPNGTRNAAVRNDSGIIRFQGALAGGTSYVAFTLPSAFRPAVKVRVPIDQCSASKARLVIEPNGIAAIESEGAFSSCIASLEGAWFALSESEFTHLDLANDWQDAPFGGGSAMVKDIGGIVHLKGAIWAGPSSWVFTLPSNFRPATNVYVQVDLCYAEKGYLFIQPNGVVNVQAATILGYAQCTTSLDGASFVR